MTNKKEREDLEIKIGEEYSRFGTNKKVYACNVTDQIAVGIINKMNKKGYLVYGNVPECISTIQKATNDSKKYSANPLEVAAVGNVPFSREMLKAFGEDYEKYHKQRSWIANTLNKEIERLGIKHYRDHVSASKPSDCYFIEVDTKNRKIEVINEKDKNSSFLNGLCEESDD